MDREGHRWPHSKSSATRSWPRNFFPDLVVLGCGGGRDRPRACSILVLKLDADYLEGAAAISQKLYERMQRARKGGGLALPTSKTAARLRIPRLPWLGGAGPLAWRQLLLAMRTSRLIILISLGLGCVLLVLALFMPGGNQGSAVLIPTMGSRVHRLLDVHLRDAASLGVSRRYRAHGLAQDAAGHSPGPGGAESSPGVSWSWRPSSSSCWRLCWPPAAIARPDHDRRGFPGAVRRA